METKERGPAVGSFFMFGSWHFASGMTNLQSVTAEVSRTERAGNTTVCSCAEEGG